MLRIFLCLLLGLMTTVAIAWTCAATLEFSGERYSEQAHLRVDGSMKWQLWQKGWGRSREAYVIGPPSPSGDPLHVPLMDAFSILRPSTSGSIERAGWPLHAFKCRSGRISITTTTFSAQMTVSDPAIEGGIALPDRVRGNSRDWRALPYHPIWIGLLFDVLVFGGIWMALLFGITPLRAQVRRWRGRCPMCGYDLRGQLSNGCPECGWRRDE